MRTGASSVAAATTGGGEAALWVRGGLRGLGAAGVLVLGLVLVQALRLDGAPPPTQREIAERVAAAPVGFVENVGQAHRSVTHLAQGPGYAFAFRRDGVRVSLVKQSAAASAAKGATAAGALSVGMEFVGANPAAKAVLAGPAGGRVDYLVGERARWRSGLATQPVLVYRDLWPGIDMAFKGSGGKLKYEFRLAAGADPGKIQLAYQGAQSLSLTSAGALQLHTQHGALTDAAPVSYQRLDGRRVPVESSFALANGNSYGFTTGAYNHNKPLIIDPGLEYSTYLGGSGNDSGFRIEVKGHDAYVTGGTPSPDFPTTAGAYDRSFNGDQDAFVSKIDTRRTGAASLRYSTFLGGSSQDFGVSIDVKGDDAYVTGVAGSQDFPTTRNAHDRTFNGGQDAFLARLDTGRRGSAGLEYSTFLGGASNDRGFEIEVTGDDAHLTGLTASADFPVTANRYQQNFGGVLDAFVTRVDTGRRGSAGLEYSTFLGGSGQDAGRGIDVEGHDAYVTGPTGSPDFPTTIDAFDGTFNGGSPPAPSDVFVTRLDTRKGSAGLEYSTYLGGVGNDVGFSMAVRGHDAYLTGEAGSADFPVTTNAFDRTFGGGGPCSPPPSPFATCDGFVTRLDTRRAGADGLRYSTFLGGAAGDIGRDIALRRHDAFVTGMTASSDFPTANPYDQTFNGAQDAFVTRLDVRRDGAAGLEYSTYLGGSGSDDGFGISLNRSDAYVTGPTGSPDFPTSGTAFDRTYNGGTPFVPTDAFVSRLDTGGHGHHDDHDEHDEHDNHDQEGDN